MMIYLFRLFSFINRPIPNTKSKKLNGLMNRINSCRQFSIFISKLVLQAMYVFSQSNTVAIPISDTFDKFNFLILILPSLFFKEQIRKCDCFFQIKDDAILIKPYLNTFFTKNQIPFNIIFVELQNVDSFLSHTIRRMSHEKVSYLSYFRKMSHLA